MSFPYEFVIDKIIETGRDIGKKIAIVLGLGLLLFTLTTNLGPTEPVSPDAPTYEYYWVAQDVITNVSNYSTSTGCEAVDADLCRGITTACKKIPYHLCGVDMSIAPQNKDCITCDFTLMDVPYAEFCMQCEVSKLQSNPVNNKYVVGLRKTT